LIDGIHAVQPRHSQIHQGDVRPVLFPKFRCLLAVAGFSDHVHVRFLLDDGDETVADDGVIFCDQDADYIRLPLTGRAPFLSRIGNERSVAGSDFFTHVHLYPQGWVEVSSSE